MADLVNDVYQANCYFECRFQIIKLGMDLNSLGIVFTASDRIITVPFPLTTGTSSLIVLFVMKFGLIHLFYLVWLLRKFCS